MESSYEKKPAEAGSFALLMERFSLEGFKVLHIPPFLLVDVVLFLKGVDVALFPFCKDVEEFLGLGAFYLFFRFGVEFYGVFFHVQTDGEDGNGEAYQIFVYFVPVEDARGGYFFFEHFGIEVNVSGIVDQFFGKALQVFDVIFFLAS